MLNIATPNGNRILNIENFRARILNIEFLRSRILNIDPSMMISIFGVVTSLRIANHQPNHVGDLLLGAGSLQEQRKVPLNVIVQSWLMCVNHTTESRS